MRVYALLSIAVVGCGGLGGHSFPDVNELPKIRENLRQCEQHVIDAAASYREAIALASAACTYAAAQEYAGAACGLAEHVSRPVADAINHAMPETARACEGLRRKARAADLTLRSAAAWRSVYEWAKDAAVDESR